MIKGGIIMQNFIMEGIGKISGGEFETITVKGVSTCSNNIKTENMRIEGVFNCSGDVETGLLYCKGVADFKANIRAKKLTVEGVLSVRGDSKIEAEEIICDGVIKASGEISTDIMKADGCVEAKEIVGDYIKINSRYQVNRFMRFFSETKSNVKLIEATTIELTGVTADAVNGRDITIGPNCRIDKLECNGILFIDKNSEVHTITGNYTMRG